MYPADGVDNIILFGPKLDQSWYDNSFLVKQLLVGALHPYYQVFLRIIRESLIFLIHFFIVYVKI